MKSRKFSLTLAICLATLNINLFIPKSANACSKFNPFCNPRPKPVEIHRVEDGGGFFRVVGKPEVYGTTGFKYCQVKDEAQMNQFGGFGKVRMIANMSFLTQIREENGRITERTFTGFCHSLPR
jgi:hypothetical protein